MTELKTAPGETGAEQKGMPIIVVHTEKCKCGQCYISFSGLTPNGDTWIQHNPDPAEKIQCSCGEML